MTATQSCPSCEWWDDVEPAEMRYRCPECGARLDLDLGAENPAETRSDTA